MGKKQKKGQIWRFYMRIHYLCDFYISSVLDGSYSIKNTGGNL